MLGLTAISNIQRVNTFDSSAQPLKFPRPNQGVTFGDTFHIRTPSISGLQYRSRVREGKSVGYDIIPPIYR